MLAIPKFPEEFRKLCREELHTSHTSGILPGYVQANLLILPAEEAEDFRDLCFRNPVACPLLAHTVGDPNTLSNSAIIKEGTFDIRADFPKYNIYEKGSLVEQKLNCRDEWGAGYVGFLIGCSYSFERALSQAGLPPRNVVEKKNVAMFKTSKMLDPAGIFIECPYVVSMRPYKTQDLPKVREITREFRLTHGEPIDWGYDGAERLGIEDLQSPEYGDSITIADDEIPVFWACGVTPQLAVETVGHLINGPVIGHTPGHMLVCDIKDENICN
ncbi:hypothetical protein HG535_0C06400 [Zygotorulaspora mrakii]|uniref:DUF1445 domain-containing protein n=1 Tax=Zygotorulaspora mrakii TaxID=42260 RepID=A0A7H9B0S3_ZYGMR|nr:uncharacterized protein HG535_0C06400 [Zygotorulaspora mrakii]QLG72285.1 hypothetical protein HG535_0C06400 [Zygotorulaspora mrakii]